MNRPSWDRYFMNLAYEASTRATCPRRHGGAVLVKNNVFMKAGYNGAPSKIGDCYEHGCDIADSYEMENGELVKKQHCVRTIHAEQNIMLFSSPKEREGATLYVTDQPCWTCANIIANSGIVKVVYNRPYKKDFWKVRNLFSIKGIEFEQLPYAIPAHIQKQTVTE
jgi:dCMP deaminase